MDASSQNTSHSFDNPPTVSVTRCVDYQSENLAPALSRNLALLGGLESFLCKGDSVLLKPNFIAPKPPRNAVQTDPALILEMVKLIKDFGAHPFIADSPAGYDVFTCIKALQLEEPLRKLQVPVKALNKPQRHKLAGSNISISTVALEADKIINMPKLKTHQQLTATFAVKNMFGCVCGKEKAYWHFAKGSSFRKFCRMLIEIYQLLHPVLNIIDCVVAMEGNGPINGRPRPLGFLIAGVDPLACERVCCELIQMNPDDVPLIRTARKLGFGCSDFQRINIVGDDYQPYICPDFSPSIQTPLRFSLVHVYRSLTRQLLLLSKSSLGLKQPG